MTGFPKPSKKDRDWAKQARRENEILRRGELRHDCLIRAKYLCECCRMSLATLGFEWHHIVFGSGKRKPREAMDTTIALCPTCHASFHKGDIGTMRRVLGWARLHHYKESIAEIERRMAKIRGFA